ncbi:MAG: sigma 54-interacting transcriptional regulator [Myxococcota bacterium]|nr:sigma 54-interacting transcriptional regulator [Myxococcota bacterium]
MSTKTPQIWILHRDAAQRAALERMIAAGDVARVGSPTDIELESSAPPRAVVLGLAGDIEIELEFAHRNAARLGDCRWLLLTSELGEAELLRLFDTVDAHVLTAPHSAAQLRGAIRQALGARIARDSLSVRRYRDRLAERFIRWFDDLGVGELLRAMDPKHANVPLVIRGERGTGRALFARYVHTFGGYASGGTMPFVEIDCSAARDEAHLLTSIQRAAGASSATLLLQRPEDLPASLCSSLLQWIEYGLPPGVASGTRLRWVASLPPAGAAEDAELLAALAGLSISVPPLRERPGAIAPFARASSLFWSNAAGQHTRDFAADAIEALELHSWPGNFRELEGVVIRALAEYSADPLEARHLRIEPDTALVSWPDAADERAEATGHTDDGASQPSLLEAELEPDEQGLPEPEWIEEDDELPLIALGPDDLIEAGSKSGAGLVAVDTTQLIESLLDALRSELSRRRVVVLKELDQKRPQVLANPVDLRLGLRGLLANLILRSREGGDLYIASHHDPAGLRGGPALRILVRHIPEPSTAMTVSAQPRAELALCKEIASAAGGGFTLSDGSARELVAVFDLPAPA